MGEKTNNAIVEIWKLLLGEYENEENINVNIDTIFK